MIESVAESDHTDSGRAAPKIIEHGSFIASKPWYELALVELFDRHEDGISHALQIERGHFPLRRAISEGSGRLLSKTSLQQHAIGQASTTAPAWPCRARLQHHHIPTLSAMGSSHTSQEAAAEAKTHYRSDNSYSIGIAQNPAATEP